MMEIVTGNRTTFKQASTGGFWSWTVTANNVTGISQLYQVEDINSPFGRIIDVAVGIPADVILSMADSIGQVQAQFAPLVSFIQPFNPNFYITVTEGDPISNIGFIPIQNIGSFGSFMTAVATPDVPWLSASPPSIAGMGKGDQAQFASSVRPATLLSADSPYTGRINIQDNRNPPTLLPVTVTVTVLPRPIVLPTPGSVSLTYNLASMSPSGAVTFVITNIGPVGSQLNFVVDKLLNNSPWLAFTPNSGGPISPSGTAIITLSVISAGVPLFPGLFTEIIRITSPNAGNSPVDVQVNLTVA